MSPRAPKLTRPTAVLRAAGAVGDPRGQGRRGQRADASGVVGWPGIGQPRGRRLLPRPTARLPPTSRHLRDHRPQGGHAAPHRAGDGGHSAHLVGPRRRDPAGQRARHLLRLPRPVLCHGVAPHPLVLCVLPPAPWAGAAPACRLASGAHAPPVSYAACPPRPTADGAEELPSEGDRASAVAGVLSDGGPHPENAAPRGGRSRLAALQSDGEAVRASQRRHGAASGRVRSRPLRLTLAMFEGCQPALGCTLILRGGDSATLREARYVTEFAAQAAYSLRLEAALLAEASLPLPFLRPRGGGGDPAEQSRPFDSEKGPTDAADEGQGRGPVSSTPGLEYRDRGVDPAEQKPSKWALMLMERPLNSAWDGRDLVLQNCWIHKSAQVGACCNAAPTAPLPSRPHSAPPPRAAVRPRLHQGAPFLHCARPHCRPVPLLQLLLLPD